MTTQASNQSAKITPTVVYRSRRAVLDTLELDRTSMLHLTGALSKHADLLEHGSSPDARSMEHIVASLQELQNDIHNPREAGLLDAVESRSESRGVRSLVHELRAQHGDMRREVSFIEESMEHVDSFENADADEILAVRRAAQDYVELTDQHIASTVEEIVPAACNILKETDWCVLAVDFLEDDAQSIVGVPLLAEALSTQNVDKGDTLQSKLGLISFLSASATVESIVQGLDHAEQFAELSKDALRGDVQAAGKLTPTLVAAVKATISPYWEYATLYRKLHS